MKNSKIRIIQLLIILYVASIIVPITHFLFSSYFILLIALLISFSFILPGLRNKYISLLLALMPIVALEFINNYENQNIENLSVLMALYRTFLFILPIFIGYLIVTKKNTEMSSILTKVIILFLIVTSITSISGLLTDSNASRIIATGNLDERVLMLYYKKNIGSYSFAYIIPLIIPMIIAMYSCQRINVIQLILILLPLIAFVYISQFTFGIILVSLSMLSPLVINKFSFRKTLIFLIIGSFFILVFRSQLGNFFYYIAQFTGSPTINERLQSIGDVLSNIKSSSLALHQRQETYLKSINSFLSSPILGTYINYGKVGNHSFFLDTLGRFGLIGFLAISLFYYQLYTKLILPFKNQKYYGYIVWSLGCSVILAILNPTLSVHTIGLFIPIISIYLLPTSYQTHKI